MIYLDYNATAPVRPEVMACVQEVLRVPANASSVHAYGRQARSVIDNARQVIAEHISVFPAEIYFTASATEAINWVHGAFSDRTLLVEATAHSAALATDNAFVLPVDEHGLLILDALEAALHTHGSVLVSIMLGNNETGVMQPVQEIAALCRRYDALLHVDMVQAFGKIALDMGMLGADMATISAHKCGGVQGAAALIIRQGIDIPPFLRGGGQEKNKRAGTENVAAIAAFGVATTCAYKQLAHMQSLRGWLNAMEIQLKQCYPQTVVFGQLTDRLPHVSCIAMQDVSQEVQLMRFDLEGIAVSAGSACTSGKIDISHVLSAMGVAKDIAGRAIRVSGGWGTTQADIDAFAESWKNMQR